MYDEILLKYYSHAEAFGADRMLLNRLPFNVSDQSHSNCRQARALQRHQLRLRFLPAAAAAADSPDTERRSGRPHHVLLTYLLTYFRTPLSGRFCRCA